MLRHTDEGAGRQGHRVMVFETVMYFRLPRRQVRHHADSGHQHGLVTRSCFARSSTAHRLPQPEPLRAHAMQRLSSSNAQSSSAYSVAIGGPLHNRNRHLQRVHSLAEIPGLQTVGHDDMTAPGKLLGKRGSQRARPGMLAKSGPSPHARDRVVRRRGHNVLLEPEEGLPGAFSINYLA